MSDILLHGATGYTGRRVARCLAERGADFSLAGRNREALREVARTSGASEIHVVEEGDALSLARACRSAQVIVTCVGPFVGHGDTAVEAALDAGIHYLDSTGEAEFVRRLIDRTSHRSAGAGIAMVPAMGFDEVPADVAAALAAGDMEAAEMRITYAVPSGASRGTIESALGVLAAPAAFRRDGTETPVAAGSRRVWTPMPPPLGPRRAVSLGLAETHLAPLHLDVSGLETYVTASVSARVALTLGGRILAAVPGKWVAPLASSVVSRFQGPPASDGRWTIVAEARSRSRWRNVALTGRDTYGLTAELLAWGACRLVHPGPLARGTLSPVGAFGTDALLREMQRNAAAITIHETSSPGNST
jgi:short subunit dehydrogenase-like uncharacterized protein